MCDVAAAAKVQVVEAPDFGLALEQAVAKVAADKTGATGH
jgi:hypothetical protein